MMRYYTKIFSLCFLPLFCFSQGLINNGAHIVYVSSAQMYIDDPLNGHYLSQANGSITPSATSTITLEGNWTNNSANRAFMSDGGGVVLAGNAQNIGGSNPTAFYNLSLAGNGVKTLAVQSTTVGGQSTFTGILAVSNSTMDLNSNTLYITNPVTGAITSSATGYIISETPLAVNPSIIRWYIRSVTGSHIYPFGVGGLKIPFTFNNTTAMGANDYVEVSTRATSTAFNLPWAGASNIGGPVVHMLSPNGGFPDGSDEVVIDRWWDITNSSAVTANITFSYRGIENTLASPYNIGLIGPQYWDGAAWRNDNLILGGGTGAVSGVGVVGTAYANNVSTFCPWVLSSQLSPLPIELINFDGQCQNGVITLNWCTASEKNNSYFIIEQSVDGVSYTPITQVFGSNTTSLKHCYNFHATSLAPINYFKLVQVDADGKKSTSKIINVNACDNTKDNITLTNNGSNVLGVLVNSSISKQVKLVVHNTLGQLVEVKDLTINEGYNALQVNLEHVSNAVYYVSVIENEELLISKKILITNF
ncbi:MAG: hypothetical protein IT237_00040 [Bacteroidia bacterium]|nr:hypothetical protein [Bacteroidia bacterium]